VLVISRFRPDDAEGFLGRAEQALGAFADRPGFLRGHVGRAADDPGLWTVVTEWDSVGSFRRSLSSFDVKVYAAQLLAESVEEPSAYEVLVSAEGSTPAVRPSALAADAGTVRVGEAATPNAPRDLPAG
jgi:heme-degrading monooxygenase HmoA